MGSWCQKSWWRSRVIGWVWTIRAPRLTVGYLWLGQSKPGIGFLGGVPGSHEPRKHGGYLSRNKLEVVVKAHNVLSQVCVRFSHPKTLPYPVFVAAELCGGSFFKHDIRNNSLSFFFSLSLSRHLWLQITLNSAKIKLPNLPQGSSSSAGSRQKIYELCVCPNGRLFLSQAGSSSTCQINTSVCLWETICSGASQAAQKPVLVSQIQLPTIFTRTQKAYQRLFLCVRARVCEYIYIKNIYIRYIYIYPLCKTMFQYKESQGDPVTFV